MILSCFLNFGLPLLLMLPLLQLFCFLGTDIFFTVSNPSGFTSIFRVVDFSSAFLKGVASLKIGSWILKEIKLTCVLTYTVNVNN